MRKPAVLFGLFALLAAPAMAQDQSATQQENPPSAPQEPVKVKRPYITPKVELSGGYTYRTYYTASGTIGMHGWYGSGDYNFFRWLGAEAEVTGAGKNEGTINGNLHIYSFLAGARITPLGHRKLTPYAHVLVGEALYRLQLPPLGVFLGSTTTITAHAYEVGGGMDLNLGRHWGVRLIEADTGSANFYPNSSNYRNQSSRRVSFGIVYRFGQK